MEKGRFKHCNEKKPKKDVSEVKKKAVTCSSEIKSFLYEAEEWSKDVPTQILKAT